MSTKLAVAALAGALAAACGNSGENAEPTTPAADLAFPPRVDEPARGGMVQDADDKPVDLATTWAERRVVLVFYRGNW